MAPWRRLRLPSGTTRSGFEPELGAEPVAGGAGAVGVVEGKQARLDLVDGETGHRAGEARGKDDPLVGLVAPHVGGVELRLIERLVGQLGNGHAVGQRQRRLQRIRQPRGDVLAHDEPVHHDVDVMREFLVQRRRLGDFVEVAVDLDPLEALLHQLREFLAILALAPAHDRRQQIEPGTVLELQHPVDHLRNGLALDGQSGRRRVGHADAGEQQAHIVVDLGDGADGRARIAAGGFLLDGDGRREALDMIHVRFLHHLQELSGVGGKRLHIAALALGVDGVEGERRLSRPRQAGDDDQLLARQLKVDALEIVLARAAN